MGLDNLWVECCRQDWLGGRALRPLKCYTMCCLSHYIGLGWVSIISGQSYKARMGQGAERCGLLNVESCAVSYITLGQAGLRQFLDMSYLARMGQGAECCGLLHYFGLGQVKIISGLSAAVRAGYYSINITVITMLCCVSCKILPFL